MAYWTRLLATDTTIDSHIASDSSVVKKTLVKLQVKPLTAPHGQLIK
jgi:hypothetical protein